MWVYPSSNPSCCPVRLIEKYIRLYPVVTQKTKKFNFYLRSLEKPTLNQWCGEWCVGQHTLSKTVKEMLKSAKLNEFFTNHSLRRSTTSRIFQNGIDRKLVKEYTGHILDAVDCYQITSDEQHKCMSRIIQGNQSKNDKQESKLEVLVQDNISAKCVGCMVDKKTIDVKDVTEVGGMLTELLSKRKGMKTSIKIEWTFE